MNNRYFYQFFVHIVIKKVGFTILESLSNYCIGVYVNEIYITNRWEIIK